jgi:hypothetical protein
MSGRRRRDGPVVIFPCTPMWDHHGAATDVTDVARGIPRSSFVRHVNYDVFACRALTRAKISVSASIPTGFVR